MRRRAIAAGVAVPRLSLVAAGQATAGGFGSPSRSTTSV